MHDKLAFYRTRFGEEVGGIREVSDAMEPSNGVEGGLWDAGAEMTLFHGIGGPCKKELGDDLVKSLARVHVCGRKRKPVQIKFR